jgi:tetratricopeptide (TPR) repeat protein
MDETREQAASQRDFFVSYTSDDQEWAEWVAWELEDVGYTTVLQAWDFVAGSNFADAMDRALKAARHLVAILSPAYLHSRYGKAEWLNAFIQDPTGEDRRLVPVRVEDCDPKGLLQGVVYIDLVGLDEATARGRLIDKVAGALRGHSRPATRPRFPTAPAKKTTPERPRFPTALPPVWNLPWRRNPDFTGRERELAALADQLKGTPAGVGVTQALAIQGGGGIGKTSLAVEYAYRHHARFEVVWWLRAEEPVSLISDYAALAAALDLPQGAQADQQQAALAVHDWLATNTRWLLVVDNAPEPAAATGLAAPLERLVDLLPHVIGGQVLVTSRDARWEREARLAALDLFTPEEAVRFLLARSASQDTTAASQVAELLGYLPLALEQAGAYTREAAISLGDYLQRLQRYPEVALAMGEPRDRDPADTVAVTWQVSLDRVRPVPGALELLQVCAFLAPDDIPRKLVARPLDPPPEDAGLAALATTPFALDQAVAALRRYGLVKATEQALALHGLLQHVVRASLAREVAASRAGVAVRLLWAAFPDDSNVVGSWPLSALLLPHALAAADRADTLQAEPQATAGLLNQVGDYLWWRAEVRQARQLYQRAHAILEARLGPNHRDVGRVLNNLGNAQRGVGDLRAARNAHEGARAILEARLDPGHADVGRCLNNLAGVLGSLGELHAALDIHRRAQSILEARLGPDDPDAANNLDNLGIVRRRLGDLDAARADHQRALNIRETRLGADHPHVAHALSSLGSVAYELEELPVAHSSYKRALRILETRLGPDHPDFASSLANLGNVLHGLRNLPAARTALERARVIFRARLGPEHPDVAQAQESLQIVLSELDNPRAVRASHRLVLPVFEPPIGSGNPLTTAIPRNSPAVPPTLGQAPEPPASNA